MRPLLAAGCLLLITTGGARAQPKPGAAETPALRYELGQRLKRFESAWEKAASAEAKARALAHAEKLTRQFFSLQFGEAARSLDLAGFALASDAAPAARRQWVWSLYAVPETRFVDGKAKELTVTIKPLYSVKGDVPKDLEVQLWFTDKQVTTLHPKEFPHKVKVPLPPLGDFKGLDRKLYFMAEAGKELRHAAIGVSQAADPGGRLTKLKEAVTGWEKYDSVEKATVRDRAELLGNLFFDGAVPETDLPAASLLANAEEMLGGKPFYTAEKNGQFWLSVPTGEKKSTPVRMFVPRGLDPKKPVPVVVALHGAGGSENLFFEGYGAGRIVAECRKRGWLLVSPRSGLLFGSAPPVPAILDELGKRYPLDRNRVFLVGHSMGAAQAVELVQKHPREFAAAAALGGGGAVRDAKAFAQLPFFIGVGEKDSLALAGARALNKSLGTGGAKRLTYKEYPAVEHMVVVREALPDAFALFDGAAGGK